MASSSLAVKRAWRAKNPEKVAAYNRRANARRRPQQRIYMQGYSRGYHLKKKYGITAGEWDVMFAAQGARCAICRADKPGGKYWHTDHMGPIPCTPAHIRGILCLHCNHAIGMGSEDDLSKQRARARYLEKWLCA